MKQKIIDFLVTLFTPRWKSPLLVKEDELNSGWLQNQFEEVNREVDSWPDWKKMNN